jgi:hypothetical protein
MTAKKGSCPEEGKNIRPMPLNIYKVYPQESP